MKMENWLQNNPPDDPHAVIALAMYEEQQRTLRVQRAVGMSTDAGPAEPGGAAEGTEGGGMGGTASTKKQTRGCGANLICVPILVGEGESRGTGVEWKIGHR